MAPKGNLRWRKPTANRAAAQRRAAHFRCTGGRGALAMHESCATFVWVRFHIGCEFGLSAPQGEVPNRLGSHEICRRTMLWRTRSVYTPR